MHTSESNAYCLGVFDYGSSGTLIGGITFRDTLVQVATASPLSLPCQVCQSLAQVHYLKCQIHSSIASLV